MTEKSIDPTRDDIILTTTNVSFFPTAITLTPPHPRIYRSLYDRIPLPTICGSLWDERVLLCDGRLYITHRTGDTIPVPAWRHHTSPGQ